MIHTSQSFTHWAFIAVFFFGVAASPFSLPGVCRANDLDDGIAADDPINKYDEIKVDLNLGFIKRDAMARSKIKKRDMNDMTATYDAVQGGVIVKPGGKVGDITIIYDGKDNTVISGD